MAGLQNPIEFDDITFLHDLDRMVQRYPALEGVRRDAINALQAHLSNKKRLFVEEECPKALDSTIRLRKERSKTDIELEFGKRFKDLWEDLWKDVRSAMDHEPKQPSITRIESVEQVRHGYRPEGEPPPERS
ncbi:unnamed protein product [Rhizoctonia solani]|uniref:Uncharacterized protein n=1 Tax=Rhizoctonia solani TaxID=456999 RepID=A0A8H3A147_9AGAM|nr:unnamed protein product [Rhizoctonia solani]